MRQFTAPPDVLCPCSKTGSHILEKILQKLGDEARELDSATQAAVRQVSMPESCCSAATAISATSPRKLSRTMV